MKRSQAEAVADAVSEKVSPSPSLKTSKTTAQVEELFSSTESLSEDEDTKLSFNYWGIKYPGAEHTNELIRRCLPEIRKAYLYIKKNSGSTLLVDLVDDKCAMSTLFHFAHSVIRMKDFLKEIGAARMTLSNLIGDDDAYHLPYSTTPKEARVSEKQLQGAYPKNILRDLLVAKQILVQLGVHPSGDDWESTLEFIEAGVKQLKSELRKAELDFMELMKRSFNLDPCQCHCVVEEVYALTRRFVLDLCMSSAYVRGRGRGRGGDQGYFEEVGKTLMPKNMGGKKEDDLNENLFEFINELRKRGCSKHGKQVCSQS